jgi:formylglycine-generating enzyme required for sulfatase activity
MEHHDPLNIVGTTVGEKYDIEAVVGEGGFGIVYRAMHKIWKQPVAIKCFKVLMDASPDMRDNLLKDFIQEGALLTQLSGRTASIVQARDVGTFTTASGAWVPYMVLEWLDGVTLEAMLDAQRAAHGTAGGAAWPIDKVIPLLEPVAQALEVVHRRGIAHRDIKPANIFVIGADTEEMHVKVLDFGIAKVVQSAAEHGSFTKTGGKVTSFTPAYGAPEQFSRSQGATGPWTDVYALALVMTELLIGRPPLEGDDFIQLGMATADPSRRPTPGSFGLRGNDALEAVFTKALAVKPQDRFATAGEFWQAVRRSQNMQAMQMSDPNPQSWVAPQGTGRTAPARTGGTAPHAAQLGSAATELYPAAAQAVSQGPSTRDPVASPTSPTPSRSKGGLFAGIGIGAIVVAGAGFFLMNKGGGDRATASPSPSSSAASVPAAAPVVSAAPPPKACAPKMARIEGGKFFMGSDEKDADGDERPAHQVTLSPYCIDLYEVTAGEYKACSDVGECKRAPIEVDWKDIRPGEKKAFSPLCNARVAGEADRGTHPINCVDWDMAATYCAAQKKRLPTEAEWEFAARGPDGRRYPWGDEAPDKTRMNACGKECLAWGAKNGVSMGVGGKGMFADDDGFPTTAPVGSFPEGKSRYGLFDVVGNVWEWTSDWDGKYAPDPVTDPTGPKMGERRIVRGGAFNGAMPSWVRPSQRYSDNPNAHSHAYGFRCAKTL